MLVYEIIDYLPDLEFASSILFVTLARDISKRIHSQIFIQVGAQIDYTWKKEKYKKGVNFQLNSRWTATQFNLT